ncbi:MAG TPA: molybdenum cofactor biosynthesis protein MoaE [Bacteroidales bacterium]|nr:molybdenum cofactor biosynthesis protein MoaE [Bacteroidales bacterium]
MKAYLTYGPVKVSDISDLLANGSDYVDSGGHSLFIGQVRVDVSDNKRVAAIEYSVYENLASAEIEKIKAQLFSEFPDVKYIEIIHSAGVVKAGEISLAVMVSAGHRQQAQQACSAAVELIKERLPVWKKEIFEDGSSRWKSAK